jgi:hypothetical protein
MRPPSVSYIIIALLFASFCAASIMTLATRTIGAPARPIPINIKDAWEPNLAQVQSIDQAMQVLPAYIQLQRGTREERITAGIDQFVRDRFFHGISVLSVQENWVAVLSGYVWFNLRIPVWPDDILKRRRAMCSQQAIVFMELLKRFGIEYGSVLFRWRGSGRDQGHFAVAAKVDGRWQYFDPNLEGAGMRVPLASVISGEGLKEIYADRPVYIPGLQEAAANGNIKLAHINRFPAPRGGAFQTVTAWLSAYGWLVLGAFWLIWSWASVKKHLGKWPKSGGSLA